MTATETLTGTRTASTSFVVATDAVRPWQRHKRRQLGKTLVSFLLVIAMTVTTTTTDALSMSLSRFHGRSLAMAPKPQQLVHNSNDNALWTMRKQKASFKRTRMMQRGEPLSDNLQSAQPARIDTMTNSPMADQNWNGGHRKKVAPAHRPRQLEKGGGRGRSRKRSNLYGALSTYQQRFLHELTAEYKAEVRHTCTQVHRCREGERRRRRQSAHGIVADIWP